MFCTHCGTEVPLESNFCFNCGVSVAALDAKRDVSSESSPDISRGHRVPLEDVIFKEALGKVLTRVYACDYCGAVLDVNEGAGKVKCSACGYVNEVDYLRRVNERLQAKRAEIIEGAM